jgi:predicted nucleic acid-binding protein
LPAVEVLQLSFITVQAPQDQLRVQQFLQKLDLGESEALTLALEVQAAVILIDEAEGRAVADQLGLIATGALGTLLRAKRHGRIAAVLPLMDRRENEIDFFISARLRADVLRLAGE